MPRSVHLTTLVGAVGGAAAVVVVSGDPASLLDGVAAWAGALPLPWAVAFVLAGATAGGGLARSLRPARRRKAAGGPSWPFVLAVLGIVAIIYGRYGGVLLRDALSWVTDLPKRPFG